MELTSEATVSRERGETVKIPRGKEVCGNLLGTNAFNAGVRIIIKYHIYLGTLTIFNKPLHPFKQETVEYLELLKGDFLYIEIKREFEKKAVRSIRRRRKRRPRA